LSSAPPSHDFETLKVGDTLSQTFVITNHSSAAVTLDTPQFTGTQASEFELGSVQTCTSLPATGTCLIEVLFKPVFGGSKSATLELRVAGVIVLRISLVGIAEGESDCVTIAPASNDFGPIAVGQSSPQQLFTLTDQCEPHPYIPSVQLTGTDASQFKVGQDSCSGRTITAPATNGSCVVEVSFQPTVAGSKTANLSLTHDYGTLTVTLTGTASQSPPDCVVVTPASKDFGQTPVNQSSAKQLFTITNQCNPHLNISAVKLAGTDASQFILTDDSCSGRQITHTEGVATPTTDGSCVVETVFQPNSAGSKQAVISISYTNGEANITVTATATTPDIVVQPSTLNFTIQ
jgi:hypothetical protein